MKLRAALLLLFAAGCLGLSSIAVASAAPVYVQPTNFRYAFASQNDVNGFGNYATSYDNFTLTGAADVTQVTWVGSYFNPGILSAISNFTVTFYANDGGVPGGALAAFGVANSSETFMQNDDFGNPTYSYSANVNISLAGSTEYWLSIVPDLVYPPEWGWEAGTGGNGSSYQCFFGSCGATGDDLAFSIYASPAVPEPGSLLLLGTGLIGVAGAIRRKLSV